MNMKLELKHIAPYLPYGLKGEFLLSDVISIPKSLDEVRKKDLTIDSVNFFINYCKPYLRPLSDLTKEIEVNGKKFVPVEWFEDKYYTLDLHKQCLRLLEEDGENWINQSDYMLVEQLIEWHFDVFGLIEQGLAIDINTFNN